MTVSTSDNREEYVGNGSTTVFPYAFKIFAAADLKVYLVEDGVQTLQVLNTDYTVSGAGEESGGDVTMTIAPTSTQSLVILREIPVVQETDLRNQGAYYPETLEDEFDRSRMIDQQQQEVLGRTLKKTRGGEHYDAGGKRIENLGDASNPGDAASKKFMLEYLKGLESGKLGNTSLVDTGSGSGQNLQDALNARVIYVDTIADLQALDTSWLVDGQAIELTDQDQSAKYAWRAGDQSANVGGDEWAVPNSDPTGASGAYQRISDVVSSRYSAQFLRTTSEIINQLPVDVSRFIPKNLLPAIKGNTSNEPVHQYIQEACDALGQRGGELFFPKGRYSIAGRITPSTWTTLKGEGRASQILANPNFSGADTMFLFENGTTSMFNSRIEDMFIRVEGVAAVKQAVHARAWQETCGLYRVSISGVNGSDKRAVVITDGFGGAAYLKFKDVEIFGDGMAAGIDVENILLSGGFIFDVEGITITGGAGVPAVRGIRIRGDALICKGLHVEYMSNGILLENGANAYVSGCTGSANEVTNLIGLDSSFTGSLEANMLLPIGAEYTIRDNVTLAHKTGLVASYSFGGVNSPSNAKAWVCFDGTTGSVKESYGVSSVVRETPGEYSVNWGAAFLNSNYVVNVSHRATNSRIPLVRELGKSSGFYRFRTQEWSGSAAQDAVTIDPIDIMVVAYANRG